MSTIKSQDEDLTLNAHGSGNDIKFQSNGVEKASISDAGLFTSTTIDATKLTGNLPAVNGSALTNLTAANLTGALPAISGAALTGVGVSGISSSADATAMTITSDENIGIGTTTPPERLSIHEPSTGTGTYLPVAITGANHATGYGVGISFKTENSSPTQKAKAAIIAEGTGEGYNKTSLHIAMSDTDDTTTEVALANSVIEFTMDGRGLSQFTAKAWCNANFNDSTPDINDSFNVSSIEYFGSTGYFGFHWDVDTADGDYAALVNCAVATSVNTGYVDYGFAQNSSYLRFQFYRNSSLYNPAKGYVVIFGD